MASLENIIIDNCPMPNIVCWARRIILQRLRELHDAIVLIRTLNPIAMKRLVCSYLDEDINFMLQKVCALEQELCSDDIITPEFECFIIEYLTEVTSNTPFDEDAVRLGTPNFFYDTFKSKIT